MEKKQYKTRGKEALLAYLRQTADAPQSCKEICLALADTAGAPSQSSVYRMLATLCESGEVKRHRLAPPEEGYTYQYVGGMHHCESHFHLHCLRCGGVWHLECDCGNEIDAHLRNTHGFSADRGRSVIYGVCAACGEKEGVTV